MSINNLEDDGTFDWVYRDHLITVAYQPEGKRMRFDLVQVLRCVPIQLGPKHSTAHAVVMLCEAAEQRLTNDARGTHTAEELRPSFEQATLAVLRVLAPNS